MNTFTQKFDSVLDAVQSILMSILTKIGPFFVALMPSLFTAYAIFHTFTFAAGFGLALFFAIVVGLAMETVGIVATHTALDLYNAKEEGKVQPIKFKLMTWLVPVYVLGVALVVYFSGDAFTPLVKGLGVASPFLTTIVYVAVALHRDISRTEAKQETIEDRQAQIEAEQRQWEREKELRELELKHAEKLARIEANKRSNSRSVDQLTTSLDQSLERSNLVNTGNLTRVNAQKKRDKEQALNAVLTYLNANSTASLNDIAQAVECSKGSAFNYVSELQQAGRLYKNGNGWEVVR